MPNRILHQLYNGGLEGLDKGLSRLTANSKGLGFRV